MKRIILILLTIVYFQLAFSQKKDIDSLLQVINTTTNDSIKATTLNSLAWKFMFTNPDTTRIISNSSIALSKKINQQTILINAINNLATSFAVQGNMDEALIHFKKAEAKALEINNTNELAMIQNNIGLVLWNQGKLKLAIETYRKALSNYSLQDKLVVGSANLYNNIGLIYNDLGKKDSAITHYKLALAIFDSLKTKSRGVANTYNNIGIIYKEQGNLPSALDYYLKALKKHEEINDKSDGYANVLSNIGIIYKEQKEYEKALEYYFKSKSTFEKLSNQSIGLANTLNNIGIIYHLKDEDDLALEYYKTALKMQEEIGEQSIGMASSLTNIGTIKEVHGLHDEASQYFEKAKKIQESIGDKKGMANSLFFLGNLHVETNRVNEGIVLCKQSLELAIELELLELKMNSCDCLADAYQRLNNASKAFEYFKKYISYRDSLLNQENTREITQKAMKFEFEKTQYQDSLIRAEAEAKRMLAQKEKDLIKETQIRRQRIYTTAGGAGFLLMMGLAVVLFRGYKNKQKANEIITAQKEEVELQKQAVEFQKEIIEEKNKEIVDSISYAKRIQTAILPSDKALSSILPDSFIYFQPKDIVSGDFYWVDKKGDEVFFAAVDCTGHGVPGAMVSVVGHNGLNRVLKEFGITKPNAMLDKLNLIVEETFEKSDESVKDGMDIALCCWNKKTNILNYSGANNPLYLIRNNELIEYKPDKQPIGKFDYRKAFTNHEIQLEKGDSIYIFSDGFADQFGGPKGKKFMYKPFKRLLTEISNFAIAKQKEILMTHFQDWKGEMEQIDDVCVMHVKIA
ncbi:MAG: hypothetical protein DWP98_05515 [Bacteroidetes bacterium]|nr:MAG: hypothetical protein DWP98_05515 [Bacteroidota bacterium]MBL1143445.1 hypothetical protein [Bacteroidota bacterium]NOG56249.1 tetratricopeptide repeat protein [Bacteroidota bacterium]